MACNNPTEYSRLIVKRSMVTGQTPTINTGETIDNTWADTDILTGELFYTIPDKKLYTRSGDDIVLLTQGTTGSTIAPILQDVLTSGNATGENWIEVEPYYGLRTYFNDLWKKKVELNQSEVVLETIQSGNTASIQLIDSGRAVIQTSNEIHFDSPSITVSTSGGAGITYLADNSEDYTNRSLVDKEYVDKSITGATSGITLSSVLLNGNTTDGNNIILSVNDSIGDGDYTLPGDDFRVIYLKDGLTTDTDKITIEANNGAGQNSSIDLLKEGTLNIGSSLEVNVNNVTFGSSTYNEARYFADYSADYTNRSLVDKEYVDNAITGSAPSLSEVLLAGNTTDGSNIVLEMGDKITSGFGDPHSISFNEGTINIDNDFSANREGRIALNTGPSLSYLYNRQYDGGNHTEGKLEFNSTTSRLNVIDTSNGAEAYIAQNLSGGFPTQTILSTDATGKMSQIYVDGTGYFNINVNDISYSTDISISPTSGFIVDTENEKGIEYAADYSATFTDRSLVDKAYVDNATPSSTLAQILVNGNTTGGNNIILSSGDTVQHFENPNLFLNGSSDGTFDYIELANNDSAYLRIRDGWDIATRTNLGTLTTQVLQNVEDGTIDLTAAGEFEGVSFLIDPSSINVSGPSSFEGIKYNGDYSANFVDRSLVDKAYVDNLTQGFIPVITAGEIFRGRTFRVDSTTSDVEGGIATLINASSSAQAVSSSSFYTKFPRLRYYASVVQTGRVSSVRGIDLQWFVGAGFRFITTFRVADTVYSVNTQQFYGLAGYGVQLPYAGVDLLNISENLNNIIGVGSEIGDTNLQIFHNDATGFATKIDLGASFPANRTSGETMTTMYSVELYNGNNETDVKYRVKNLETGVLAQGTITTNLPLSTQGLTIHATRAMGSPTTNTGQFELHKWGCSDIIF